MMGRKGQKDFVDQYDMLEIVDDTFTVQEIHGGSQPVPVQGFCESKLTGSTGHICDGNDLLEGHNLDSSDNGKNIEMAHKHGTEEGPNHHESPYRTCNEGLLLLFVLGHWSIMDLFRGEMLASWSAPRYWGKRTTVVEAPLSALVGEPGSERPSLISEKLLLRPSTPVLWAFPLRWLNFMLRRGAMTEVEIEQVDECEVS
jgi:hypothetical protein